MLLSPITKAMNAVIFRLVPVVEYSGAADLRSLPAQVGSSCPLIPVVPVNATEHPEQMSSSALPSFTALEPVYESKLVKEYPPSILAAALPES